MAKQKTRSVKKDESLEQAVDKVNTFSSPSDLKITDMRLAVVCSNYDYPIIRIDTNQGVYGIGEVRDAGHIENACSSRACCSARTPQHGHDVPRR